MKNKKENKRKNIFANRWGYTFIAVFILALFAVGVYAYGTSYKGLHLAKSSGGEINFTGGFTVPSGNINILNGQFCIGNACLTKAIAESLTTCGQGYSLKIIHFPANLGEDDYSITGGFAGNSNIVSEIIGTYRTIVYEGTYNSANMPGYSDTIQHTLFSYGCSDPRCNYNSSTTYGRTDTCDGNSVESYTCASGEHRICTDVFRPEGNDPSGNCRGACYGRLVTCKEVKKVSIACTPN